MKYITLDELLQRKHELIQEREEKLKALDDQARIIAVAYDNAIALADELIEIASAKKDEG